MRTDVRFPHADAVSKDRRGAMRRTLGWPRSGAMNNREIVKDVAAFGATHYAAYSSKTELFDERFFFFSLGWFG
jgi:hypothetical protein